MILDNPSDPKNGFNQQVRIAYKGNSSWPAFGTTKFLEMVAIANRLMDDWATDSDVLWNSLFALKNLATITGTDQQTWALTSDVFYLSDSVYIMLPSPYPAGSYDEFQVVHPNARNNSASGVGMIGSNYGLPSVYLTGSSQGRGSNLTMNFVDPLNDRDVGGYIQFGCYVMPTQFAAASDIIPVDNPQWLVFATAAELARNDPSKQDQLPNLVGMANQLYAKMTTANEGNSYQQPNAPSMVNMPNAGLDTPQYGGA